MKADRMEYLERQRGLESRYVVAKSVQQEVKEIYEARGYTSDLSKSLCVSHAVSNMN
jgi:hypothetical protein